MNIEFLIEILIFDSIVCFSPKKEVYMPKRNLATVCILILNSYEKIRPFEALLINCLVFSVCLTP